MPSTEVGHGDEGLVGTVTTGFGLGGLQKAVESLQDTVGNLALEPAEHAAPVIHEAVGDLDEGW